MKNLSLARQIRRQKIAEASGKAVVAYFGPEVEAGYSYGKYVCAGCDFEQVSNKGELIHCVNCGSAADLKADISLKAVSASLKKGVFAEFYCNTCGSLTISSSNDAKDEVGMFCPQCGSSAEAVEDEENEEKEIDIVKEEDAVENEEDVSEEEALEDNDEVVVEEDDSVYEDALDEEIISVDDEVGVDEVGEDEIEVVEIDDVGDDDVDDVDDVDIVDDVDDNIEVIEIDEEDTSEEDIDDVVPEIDEEVNIDIIDEDAEEDGEEVSSEENTEEDAEENEEDVSEEVIDEETDTEASNEETDNMNIQYLAPVDEMEFDENDIQMAFYNDVKDPCWTVLIKGSPVATIKLSDQDKIDEITDLFISDDYAQNVEKAMLDCGVKEVLNQVKARYFVNKVEESDLAKIMSDKIKGELEAGYKAKAASLSDDFKSSIAVVLAGMNKNFWKDIENPLKGTLFSKISDCGISDPSSVIESAFAESGDAYFETVLAKAIEFMQKSTEAREEIANAIGDANIIVPTATAGVITQANSLKYRLDRNNVMAKITGTSMTQKDKDTLKSKLRLGKGY